VRRVARRLRSTKRSWSGRASHVKKVSKSVRKRNSRSGGKSALVLDLLKRPAETPWRGDSARADRIHRLATAFGSRLPPRHRREEAGVDCELD
jgi:hypothetical protein